MSMRLGVMKWKGMRIPGKGLDENINVHSTGGSGRLSKVKEAGRKKGKTDKGGKREAEQTLGLTKG